MQREKSPSNHNSDIQKLKLVAGVALTQSRQPYISFALGHDKDVASLLHRLVRVLLVLLSASFAKGQVRPGSDPASTGLRLKFLNRYDPCEKPHALWPLI